MSNTFKALLRGNRLEWSGEVPERLNEDQPLRVSVTILEGDPGQGQRMAEALEKLAQLNVAAAIPDPLSWEREQREDRKLLDSNS